MPTQEQEQAAEFALANFKKWMAQKHPWVPGVIFAQNPGLDEHILKALEAWVSKKTVRVCDCPHGGPDKDDHTPGRGCEHLWCNCTYWVEEED